MERTLYSATFKSYLMLTKPGIILGNALTAATGFTLAAAPFNLFLFFSMLGGLTFIIAASCIFNNYIDRVADAKMLRTRSRSLAQGNINHHNALFLASCLMVSGIFILIFFTNFLTTFIALLGVFGYVFVYSFLKYRSPHATLIGSIAGAVPPVVGYTAVTRAIDNGAVILFFMVALWQMPHFYAIAVYRIQEYAAAGIPVFPLKRGLRTTKIQMLFYIFAFTLATSLLSYFQYTGKVFLIIAVLCGISWLMLALKGFNTNNDSRWARHMFIFSLIVINILCFTLPFSL